MFKPALVFAGIVAALALVWLLRGTLPLIAIAIFYAIATWPLVRVIPAMVPRPLTVVTVNVGIAVVILAVSVALGPALVSHAASLASAFPGAAGNALAKLPPWASDGLLNALRQVETVPLSFSLLRSASAMLEALVLIPVLASYLQLDKERYEDALLGLIPPAEHARLKRALAGAAHAIGAFARGQILVSSIVGVMVFAVLLICRIPFAGSIALLTGVFDLVPYLGGIVAFLPSLAFAFVSGGLTKVLLVGVLLLATFQIEAQFLAPQIIGSRTRLFPSAVLIVLIIGTALFGIVGLYLAVPVTAACVAAFHVYMEDS